MHLIFGFDLSSRANLDVVALFKDALYERAADNSAFDIAPVASGLIDVEGSCNEHHGILRRIALRDREILVDCLKQNADIDAFLCGNGNNGRIFGNRSLNKLLYLFVVGECLILRDDIDLVLNDDDILDSDKLQSH